MKKFSFQLGTFQVLFEIGIAHRLTDSIRDYDAKNILIVTDKGIKQAELLESIAKSLACDGYQVSVFDDIEPDPGLTTVDNGVEFYKENHSDLIVALGGGSPIDTAKGIRAVVSSGGTIRNYIGMNKVPKQSPIPLVALPTTSGTGSEVTSFAVFSDWDNNVKKTVGSPYLVPDKAIVDPSLTVSVPKSLTAASGMDAMAHAIESFVSNGSQPISDILALKAITIISANLRSAVSNGHNLDARSAMSLGSLLAGMAFNSTMLGLTHSVGASLSGRCHVSHGNAISLLLPYVMDYNKISCLEKYRSIAIAMGVKVDTMTLREAAIAACRSVRELVLDIGLPLKLRDIGIGEDVIEGIAEDTLSHSMLWANPRLPTKNDIVYLLREAL